MSCYPQAAGETDVVFQVAWVCSATDGTNNTATYGSVEVTYKAGEPFTPYADITLEQANSWVASALGPEGIAKAEADCDAQLEAMAHPTTVILPLPWNG
jgi:hypothetical protein